MRHRDSRYDCRMSLYGRLFARFYDRIVAGTERAGMAERRRELLAGASGRVLELGAGTGANLEHYPANVTELVLAEPEEPMAVRLDRRCASVGRPAEIVRAPAESLPFPERTFDTVVATLVLCTVSDPELALSEVRRVLRPGGKLLVLEHVRSEDQRTARWQDRLNPIQRKVGHGCNCNRDTASMIGSAGFEVGRLERGEINKAPPHIRPLIEGTAVLV